ncbi:unnamed protein product [Phytomonas sp. EM1]|nr:unnamed protein product [Phytomonas sp. EM1]|eukprot:CCW62154.1 unnamed protein product [Phytomonas sp. isolate EM1]
MLTYFKIHKLSCAFLHKSSVLSAYIYAPNQHSENLENMTHHLQHNMRPWCLRGEVIHGHGRGGTQLGYPTANIKLDEATVKSLTPYAETVMFGWGCIEPEVTSEGTGDAGTKPTETQIKGEHLGPFPMALSVGTNIHFKETTLSAEAHFLHVFPENFYGRIIRIIALDIVRVQTSFDSLEALIAAIDNDIMKINAELAKPEHEKYQKHELMLPYSKLTQDMMAHLPHFTEI